MVCDVAPLVVGLIDAQTTRRSPSHGFTSPTFFMQVFARFIRRIVGKAVEIAVNMEAGTNGEGASVGGGCSPRPEVDV